VAGTDEIMKAIGGLQADMKNLSGWIRSEIRNSKSERKEIFYLLHGKDADKPGVIGRLRNVEEKQKNQTKVLAGIVIFLVGGFEAIKSYVKAKFFGG